MDALCIFLLQLLPYTSRRSSESLSCYTLLLMHQMRLLLRRCLPLSLKCEFTRQHYASKPRDPESKFVSNTKSPPAPSIRLILSPRPRPPAVSMYLTTQVSIATVQRTTSAIYLKVRSTNDDHGKYSSPSCKSTMSMEMWMFFFINFLLSLRSMPVTHD